LNLANANTTRWSWGNDRGSQHLIGRESWALSTNVANCTLEHIAGSSVGCYTPFMLKGNVAVTIRLNGALTT